MNAGKSSDRVLAEHLQYWRQILQNPKGIPMNAEAPALRAKDAPDLGTFDWADPFRLSDQLSEDERMIQDSARAYAQEKLQPRAISAFADEETDADIFKAYELIQSGQTVGVFQVEGTGMKRMLQEMPLL